LEDFMIRSHEPLGKPIQPQGWPIAAHTNIAIQARQEAEGQRRRADQLARRCRRLRAVTAMALTATVAGMAAAFALGALFGYGLGSGLIGLVSR
jgi:hypothetical protein